MPGSENLINEVHQQGQMHQLFVDNGPQQIQLNDEQRQFILGNKKLPALNKKENSDHITANASKLWQDAFSLIGDVLARRQILGDKEELCDFAAFIGEDALEAMDLLTLFIGEDEECTGMDKTAALDKMRDMVMEVYPESLEPCDDVMIAQNSKELEELTWKVASFDRLSDKYDYLKELSPKKKKQTEDKLTKLRSTANYYLARKDIITDPAYIEQKGDEAEDPELSMKFKDAELAEKNMLQKTKLPTKQLLEKNFDRSEMMKMAEELISKSVKRRELQL